MPYFSVIMPGRASIILVLWCLSLQVPCTVAQSNGDIRLVGGQWAGDGRLEVYYNGRWGGVCDDFFVVSGTSNDAIVACRQLGFPTAHPAASTVTYNNGGFFLLDNVKCTGSESALHLCPHKTWGDEDCGDSEHVHVTCDNPCTTSNPCQNGGTCRVTQTGYRCVCTSKYTGTQCQSDINECLTNNGGCSHACVNTDGSYVCQCPDVELQLGLDNRTCYAPGVQVTCTSQSMEVGINKQDFPGLHAQYLTLIDSNCTATDTPAYIDVSVPLDGCGTQMQVTGDDFVFENMVIAREVSVMGLVSHVRDMNMTVRCRYNKYTSARNFYLVTTGELSSHSDSVGNYNIVMDLVHNGTEYHSTSSQPLRIKPGEKLSIKFSLLTNDSHLQVFARNCKATPTSVIDNPVQYSLLENGCGHDSTLTFKNVSSFTEERLTFDTFKFVNRSDTVYFHCEVLVCNVTDPASRCHQGCLNSGRGRRGDGGAKGSVFLTSHTLSSGPVRIKGRLSKRSAQKGFISRGSSQKEAWFSQTDYIPITVSGMLFALSAVMFATALYIIFMEDTSSTNNRKEEITKETKDTFFK